MATLQEREHLKSALLAKGIEWDDDRINRFIDSQQSNENAARQSTQNLIDIPTSGLPHTKILGGPQPDPDPALYEDTGDLFGGGVGLGLDRSYLTGSGAFEPPPEQRNAAIDAVGNALWNFIDIGSFGAAGYLQSKAGRDDPNRLDTLEDFLTGEEGPTTFAGRAGAGLGGLAGFIGPMGLAKGITGGAVKLGSKYGTRAAGKKMLEEASSKSVLGSLKGFQNLKNSEKSKIFKPFIEGLEYNSKSGLLNSSKGRKAFQKSFDEQLPNVLKESLSANGINIRSKKKLDALEEIVKRNVFNFNGNTLPIHTLQQRIAIALGRSEGAGKIANISSHALEEAIMFSMVETPMEFFNSMEEDREADYVGTLKHSFGLGSALGLIRLVPGGKDQGIVREGWRRLMGYKGADGLMRKGVLANKRSFSAYDIHTASDREALTMYVQSLYKTGNMGKILSDKGLKKVGAKVPGSHIGLEGGLDDIAALGKTPEGAATLKQIMTSVEKDWNKIWMKEWVKESTKDMIGSTPRMMMGAMAFNYDLIFGEGQHMPLEDKIFNVLVGAFMTKKGRTVEYTDANGKLQSIGFTERPFSYSNRINDAAKYLDLLGMNHNSMLAKQLVKEYELKGKYFSIDGSSSDVKSLLGILEKGGFVVESDKPVGKTKSKDPGLDGYHPLYEHIMMLVDGPLTPGNKRMLRPGEISKKRIAKLEKILSDTKFEGSDTGSIRSVADVDNIMFKASEPKLNAMYDIYHRFVRDVYEKLGGRFIVDENGATVVQLVPKAGSTKAGKVNARDWEVFQESYQRALNVLGRLSDKGKRIKIDPSKKRTLEFNEEGVSGLKEIAEKYEREINQLVYADEGAPIGNRIRLGEELLNTWMESQSYHKGVRDIYDKLTDIHNKKGTWDKAEDADIVNKLINQLFVGKNGLLADGLQLDLGKGSAPNDGAALLDFANALHQVLKVHPNYKTQFGLSSDTGQVNKMNVNDVRELRKILHNNGMGGFAVDQTMGLERFVSDLKRVTLDKQLASATDSNGNLLNDIHRSKIKYMMESGLIDNSFNIIRMGEMVDRLGFAFEGQVGIPASESSLLRLEKQLGQEAIPVEGLYLGKDGLFRLEDLKTLRIAAERNGQSVKEFSDNLVKKYKEHVEPLMTNDKGNGILTPSTTKADMTPDILGEIVARMDMIDIAAERTNHQRLMKDLETLADVGNPNSELSKFTSTLYHRFWNRSHDSRQLINILARHNLWRRDKAELDLTNQTAVQDAKTALKEINRIIPYSDTASRVEQRIHEYMDQTDMKYSELDNFKIITPNEYRENYGVDTDTISEILNDSKRVDPVKDLLDKVEYVKQGVDKTLKYKQLDASEQRKVLMDTITLYKNSVNTRNIKRIMVGEGVGAIVDNTNTATDNSLFKFLDEVVGTDNFSIVDFKVMTSNGVLDARTNNNAASSLANILYDTHAGINRGLKKSTDDLGSRISYTENSVLISIPGTSWGIGLSREKLPELSKIFVETLESRRTEYPELYDHFMNVFTGGTAKKITINKGKETQVDKVIYEVDKDVSMAEDPRIIGGDGKPRDVWIVKDLEAAQRQLENIKAGAGGGKNFSDTIDRFEDHYIIKHNKGDDKHIYIEGEGNVPRGLRDDPGGRIPGEPYIKQVTSKETTYQFKHSGGQQDAKFATEMLTFVWMDKQLGKNWWDSVNNALDTKNPEAFAKLATRFKLMSNISMYGMDKKMTDLTLKHLKEIDANTDHVKGLEKMVKNDGMKIVVVADEGFKTGGSDQFSTYKHTMEQIKNELNENSKIKGRQDDISIDKKDWGGSEDASLVDSYMPVSYDTMKALEALNGAAHVDGIGGIKPIIHKYAGADGRGVVLGKTVFVYSKEFDPFFAKNSDVNGIMFKSAEKGGDPTLNVLELGSGETISSLLDKAVDAKYKIKLGFKDIELGATVRPDHEATLSQQMGTDLNISEGNILYDWLVDPKLQKLLKKSSEIFNEYDPAQSIAFAKYSNKIPDTYDGMSAYSRWLKHDGIPISSPFIQTMKNSAKRVLIDDNGLLTMKTKHGGQSVLVPDLPFVDRMLRNTTFVTDDSGMRRVYSYGQIEIGDVNRNKVIDLNKLHFIEHNPKGRDRIINAKEFLKKEGKGLDIDDTKTLGEVHDAIKNLDNFEIAITSNRTPRTRPGDIVIVGLKGFLDSSVGNQARINVFDLKNRMEGDFDVDKVNYWWDTPGELLNKWDAMSGFVGGIKANQVKTSLDGLGWGNPGSIERMNSDQANANMMRGTVVKMQRILQFLEQYGVKDGKSKVIFNSATKSGRIVLDEKKLEIARKQLANDIQSIVDSKNGFDVNLFKTGADGWENKFLFGERTDLNKEKTYKGIFSWETYDAKKKRWEVESNIDFMDNKYWRVGLESINALLSPYKGLLQVGSGVFEDGKRRSVRYEDLMEATGNYERRLKNAHIQAQKMLRKNNVDEATIQAHFKDKGGNFVNPFGDIVANATYEPNLLPFERVLKRLDINDSFRVSKAKRMFGEQLANFEKGAEKWIQSGGEAEQLVLRDIVGQIKKDTKMFGYFNYLNWRINKQSRTMYEQRRQGNNNLADTISREVDRLSTLRDNLNETMMTDKNVLSMLITQSQKRITYEILNNWGHNKWKGGFKNYQQAAEWVGRNQKTILGWAKKNPLRIRGVETNEQMDMIIWDEMLSKFKDIYIAPEFGGKLAGGMSKDLELKIYKFKKQYANLWKTFFDNKKRKSNKKDPWMNEEMIMEQASSMFDSIFNQMEMVHEGLGRLALLKVMAPTKEVGAMTYFNGKFMESFRGTSPTYIKFGLRWLSNTDKVPELVKDTMFKQFANDYNALYKTFRGLKSPESDFAHDLYRNTIEYNRENLYTESAPLIDVKLDPVWKTTPEYASMLSEINPDIAATFGYNPNFTVGYLLSSRLVGPEWLAHAKTAAGHSYTPTSYIPQDYSGGKLPSITGWESYNLARAREAKIFLGNALGKNVLYVNHNPKVGAVFGEAQGTGRQTPKDLDQIIQSKRDC